MLHAKKSFNLYKFARLITISILLTFFTECSILLPEDPGTVTPEIILAIIGSGEANPPSNLTYTGSPFSFQINVAVPTKTPTVTGVVTTCTSNPNLPTGLVINESTCAISGTPTTLQTARNYEIKASNPAGSTISNIQIAVVPSPDKDFTAFSILGNIGNIYENTINLTVPFGTSISAMVSTFTVTGASVNISGTPQVSGTTTNDFTTPKVFTVVAADGTTKNYTVTVTVPINRNWAAITSSSDGTKLAAVVNSGQIYTSTDSGITWTARESARGWTAITSSTDGTKLVAVASPGQIYTSSDSGVNWTARENTRQWSCITSSSNGTKLVAGINPGNLFISTDSGVTWTEILNNSRNWYHLASTSDGSKLAAIQHIAGQLYLSSDSGINWTAHDTGRSGRRAIAISNDGTKLVFVGMPGVYTSIDGGINWTTRLTSTAWESVTGSSDGTKLAAVVSGGQIYTSTDSGANWTARENSRSWKYIIGSADGTKLAAVVSGGQIYTSRDSGLTWAVRF